MQKSADAKKVKMQKSTNAKKCKCKKPCKCKKCKYKKGANAKKMKKSVQIGRHLLTYGRRIHYPEIEQLIAEVTKEDITKFVKKMTSSGKEQSLNELFFRKFQEIYSKFHGIFEIFVRILCIFYFVNIIEFSGKF